MPLLSLSHPPCCECSMLNKETVLGVDPLSPDTLTKHYAMTTPSNSDTPEQSTRQQLPPLQAEMPPPWPWSKGGVSATRRVKRMCATRSVVSVCKPQTRQRRRSVGWVPLLQQHDGIVGQTGVTSPNTPHPEAWGPPWRAPTTKGASPPLLSPPTEEGGSAAPHLRRPASAGRRGGRLREAQEEASMVTTSRAKVERLGPTTAVEESEAGAGRLAALLRSRSWRGGAARARWDRSACWWARGEDRGSSPLGPHARAGLSPGRSVSAGAPPLGVWAARRAVIQRQRQRDVPSSREVRLRWSPPPTPRAREVVGVGPPTVRPHPIHNQPPHRPLPRPAPPPGRIPHPGPMEPGRRHHARESEPLRAGSGETESVVHCCIVNRNLP
mmetsp:Transcript_35107/g.88708  ORF Transcript_35107/g.88708 Transcript_35107/m.88708 type:complete len:383 (+) Transcript_35107:118-1266(+)